MWILCFFLVLPGEVVSLMGCDLVVSLMGCNLVVSLMGCNLMVSVSLCLAANILVVVMPNTQQKETGTACCAVHLCCDCVVEYCTVQYVSACR